MLKQDKNTGKSFGAFFLLHLQQNDLTRQLEIHLTLYLQKELRFYIVLQSLEGFLMSLLNLHLHKHRISTIIIRLSKNQVRSGQRQPFAVYSSSDDEVSLVVEVSVEEVPFRSLVCLMVLFAAFLAIMASSSSHCLS